MSGKLYAVGVGPGDPELITVKGQRLLREADAVFLPAQDGRPGIARQIVAPWVDASKLRELKFRMSAKPDENASRWREHAAAIAAAVNSGQGAVFVTEGDPMLFSTFIHVYRALLAGFPDVAVEVVPGVSSVTAAAAVALRPLGDDRERVAIVPATGDVMHALATFDTVIVLKVSMGLEAILKALHTTGRTDQAIYVERAGWPEQRVVTDVESLRKQKLDYFGQIIVSR